jgi:hypothetical protein
VVVLTAGCAYHNAIYNAERLYREGERLRRAGLDELAAERYREVVRKTADAYRARPDADWAGEALSLLGRSRLRLGESGAARSALEEAVARVAAHNAPAVGVWLAEALAASGEERAALERVEMALEAPLEGTALAEAHLVRGRLQLGLGQPERAWWSLDRAAEADPAVRVEAALARLDAALDAGHRESAARALDLLLAYEEGGGRRVAVTDGVARAREAWGAGVAARLLGGADSARWEREARGRIRLERARLLRDSGASTQAADVAWQVAEGLGAGSAEARAMLARWHLEGARDLVEAFAVRRILLPAGGDTAVATLVDAVDALETYAGVGLDEPLGLFAAGEVARDRLGADYLARGLFLAYADGSPDEPWAPKALLAALQVATSEPDRAWLRGRLEAHAASPYVLAAHGGPPAGFEALEEELAVRLRDITGR